MILLVLIASVLISGVTIYQYRETLKDYHAHRLERKEEQVKQSVKYTLQKTTYPQTTENLALIFKDDIYQIADVLNAPFNIYDLEGQMIKSSRPRFEIDVQSNCLDAEVLNNLASSVTRRYLEKSSAAGDRFQASYTYINDGKFKPIGILNLPYFENNALNDMELREALIRLGWVYFLMLLIAIGLA